MKKRNLFLAVVSTLFLVTSCGPKEEKVTPSGDGSSQHTPETPAEDEKPGEPGEEPVDSKAITENTRNSLIVHGEAFSVSKKYIAKASFKLGKGLGEEKNDIKNYFSDGQGVIGVADGESIENSVFEEYWKMCPNNTKDVYNLVTINNNKEWRYLNVSGNETNIIPSSSKINLEDLSFSSFKYENQKYTREISTTFNESTIKLAVEISFNNNELVSIIVKNSNHSDLDNAFELKVEMNYGVTTPVAFAFPRDAKEFIDFSYKEKGAYVYITGINYHKYKDPRFLVVPEELDGKPVRAFDSDALYDGAFDNVVQITIPYNIMVKTSPETLGQLYVPSIIVRGVDDYHEVEYYELLKTFSEQEATKEILLEKDKAKSKLEVRDGVHAIFDNTEYVKYAGKGGKVTVPSGVNKICNGAFSLLEDVEVYLPDGVKEIEEGAFKAEFLKDIRIPDSIERCDYNFGAGIGVLKFNQIGDFLYVGNETKKNLILVAFAAPVNVETLEIPLGVKIIGRGFVSTKVGITFKGVEIPSGVVQIASNAFRNISLLSRVVLPETLKIISSNAFSYCNINELILPEGLEEIGIYAFYGNASLETISIPSSVKTIEAYAFNRVANDKLISVTLNSTNCELGNYVFNANTVNTNNKDGLRYIGNGSNHYLYCIGYEEGSFDFKLDNSCYGIVPYALNGLLLEDEFEVPSGVKFIGESAFANTYFTSVTFNCSIEKLPNHLFLSCKRLETVTLNSAIKEIEDSCFYNSSIERIEFKDYCGLREIGRSAFAYTKLKSINFLQNVTYVGEDSFYRTQTFEQLYIEKDIAGLTLSGLYYNSVDVSPFLKYYKIIDGNLYGRGGDKLVKYLKTNSTKLVINNCKVIGRNAFSDFPTRYKEAKNLDEYDEITLEFEMPNTVEIVEERAFSFDNAEGVRFAKLNLSENLRRIEAGAFQEVKLNSLALVLPSKLEYIGEDAFCNFEAQEVFWHESKVKIIPQWCFASASIKNISIPSSVIAIDEYAFENSGLNKIDIGPSITKIMAGGFADCEDLKEINFQGTNLEYIGEDAFEYASATRFELPEGLLKIHTDALSNSSAKFITLPSTLVEIEEGVNFGDLECLIQVIDRSGLYEAYNDEIVIKNNEDEQIRYDEKGFAIIRSEDEVILYDYDGIASHVEIPEGVTLIKSNAFFKKDVLEVKIPRSVKRIEVNAFIIPSSILSFKFNIMFTLDEFRALVGEDVGKIYSIENSETNIDWAFHEHELNEWHYKDEISAIDAIDSDSVVGTKVSHCDGCGDDIEDNFLVSFYGINRAEFLSLVSLNQQKYVDESTIDSYLSYESTLIAPAKIPTLSGGIVKKEDYPEAFETAKSRYMVSESWLNYLQNNLGATYLSYYVFKTKEASNLDNFGFKVTCIINGLEYSYYIDPTTKLYYRVHNSGGENYRHETLVYMFGNYDECLEKYHELFGI